MNASRRRSAAQQRREEKTGAWKSTLAVAVAIGAALIGLTPLLQGFGWWFATMAMVVLLLGVAATLRARGVPEVTVVAVTAIVWGGLVVVLYAGSTLWFLLPTLSTLTDISGDLADARLSIAQQEVPAIADGAITQLIVMSVGLIAVITDELATGLRTPVLSGIGPLAVLAIAPLVRRTEPNVTVYVLTAAAFLAVIWCSSRIGTGPPRLKTRPTIKGGRNPALAFGIAAGAVATMIVLPAVTPGLTAESLADDGSGNRFPSVYATGIDPTIQLGRDLRRSDPVLSLTYTTTSADGLYLKMVNLGDFTGGTWQPELPLNAVGYDGQEFGTPPGLAPDVPIEEVDTTVSIATLRSDWLPLPYPTQRVDELNGSWLLTPTSFTVTDLQGDTRGLNYQVTGLDINPTAEQLAGAGAVVPDAVRDYLALPDDLPPIITSTAAEVASGAATNYDRAVALQEYFRSGQFRYSLAAPVSGGYDGDNAEMIAAFLEAKEGYCVHFAAAMAVMARTLGIPSRIAVGYAPGQAADRVAEGGRAAFEVYTDQLHAWPELYFDGIGWLPFEPTPGLDITPPDYSLPDYALAGGAGSSASNQSTGTATADPNAQRDDQQNAFGSLTPEQILMGQIRGWATFAAVLGGIFVIVIAPWTVRWARRRGRIRRLSTDELPGTLAWTEFEDTLDDHRVQRSVGDTMFDLERRLRDDVDLPEPAIDRLRRQVEYEQYAPPGSADSETRERIRSDLVALISALEGRAPTRERYRARLLPASLWRRRRAATPTGTLVP
ncbi:transglutaminaseTgpA domain-containing protein [Herbiconiux sp. P16]|uniref:transglutaminase family protein n=1 Tax=Herbiconiux wuyangfengii TaxID=3342794 RepID=UPI0035B8B739